MVEADGIEPRVDEADKRNVRRFELSDGTISTQSAGNGGGGRDRTDDLKLAKLPLSQLSYAPAPTGVGMVGLGRLELPTSRLSSARSNQLSYRPPTQTRPFSPMAEHP